MRITELTFYLAIQFIKKTEDNFLKLKGINFYDDSKWIFNIKNYWKKLKKIYKLNEEYFREVNKYNLIEKVKNNFTNKNNEFPKLNISLEYESEIIHNLFGDEKINWLENEDSETPLEYYLYFYQNKSN